MEISANRQSSELRETYLAEVTARLTGRLRPVEVYESVEELRQHLNAMSAAFADFGMSDDEAMAAAIRKFGPARRVGSSLLCSSSKTGWEALSPTRRVAATLATALYSGALSGWLTLTFIGWLYTFPFRGVAVTRPADLILCLGAATILLPATWFLRKLHPALFGGLAAVAMNAILIFTIYPFYMEFDDGFARAAVVGTRLTIAMFVLATAMGYSMRLLARDPSQATRPRSQRWTA